MASGCGARVQRDASDELVTDRTLKTADVVVHCALVPEHEIAACRAHSVHGMRIAKHATVECRAAVVADCRSEQQLASELEADCVALGLHNEVAALH